MTKIQDTLNKIANDGEILTNHSNFIIEVAEIINKIKERRYDELMPQLPDRRFPGAVLLHNDLDGTRNWAEVDPDIASDQQRRDYLIHVALANFVNTTIAILSKPLSPSMFEGISPTQMELLGRINDDLIDIAVANSDSSVPFEERLDGNRDLFGGYRTSSLLKPTSDDATITT